MAAVPSAKARRETVIRVFSSVIPGVCRGQDGCWSCRHAIREWRQHDASLTIFRHPDEALFSFEARTAGPERGGDSDVACYIGGGPARISRLPA